MVRRATRRTPRPPDIFQIMEDIDTSKRLIALDQPLELPAQYAHLIALYRQIVSGIPNHESIAHARNGEGANTLSRFISEAHNAARFR